VINIKLYKVWYEFEGVIHLHTGRFKSLEDFWKLLEIEGKDLSKYTDARLCND